MKYLRKHFVHLLFLELERSIEKLNTVEPRLFKIIGVIVRRDDSVPILLFFYFIIMRKYIYETCFKRVFHFHGRVNQIVTR